MSGGQYDADDPVRAALRRLIDQGLMSDVGIDHVVPPAIQNSWRRSIASKVDPSGHPRIEDIGSHEDLIREAAGRVMDRWYGSLTNTRATLLLGNAQGHIIWRRTIDARDRRTLDQVGAVEGSDFSEGSSGTNGLGTAIEGRQPILIRGSQHFLESLRDVACAAAPVIHPLTGRVTGSVSLTSPAQEANDFMVALVRQASQEISDALLEGSDSRDVALARAFRKARSGSRGVVVMNRDTVMSDLPALSYLDAELQAQIWDQLVSRLGVGEQRNFDLPEAGLTGTVRNVGASSEPVLELQLSAPTEDPQQKLASSSRPRPVAASDAASTPPPEEADQAVAAWWSAMNRAAVGKGRELPVPVPAGSDGEKWIRSWSKASGRPARAVAASLDAGERGSEDMAADGVPVFPTLRHRRSALADLARGAYRGESPPPRFTAEALSALLSWHWPGDMAELAKTINGLRRTAENPWTVDVNDLPPQFLAAPRRRLSRWDQAERDSVLAALGEAKGNKSEAAAMLGIGRTTLYRKIRSLSIDQRQIDAVAEVLSLAETS